MADTENTIKTSLWQKVKKYVIAVGLVFSMAGTASAGNIISDIERYSKSRNKGKTGADILWKIGKETERQREQKRQQQRREANKRQNAAERKAELHQKAIEEQQAASLKMQAVADMMAKADIAWQNASEAAKVAEDNIYSAVAKNAADKAFKEATAAEKNFLARLEAAQKADDRARDDLMATGGDPYAQPRAEARDERTAMVEARIVAHNEALERLAQIEQKQLAEKIRLEQQRNQAKMAKTGNEAAPATAPEATPAATASGTGKLTSVFKKVGGFLIKKKMGIPTTTNINIHLTPGNK